MPEFMKETSKLIALALRHKPEVLNLEMDGKGWVSTTALVNALNARRPFTMGMLEEIVRTDAKQRYSFSEDKTRIRANQGHSIPVDLELLPQKPPKVLWHGTGDRFADDISREGLKKQGRQYVHLTDNRETAAVVGKRHGRPVVFEINAALMYEQGYVFYRSENGVWLTDVVPPEYLSGME